MSGTDLVFETLIIRNMVSNCCVILLRERLEVIESREMIMVEQIKQAVIELIHHLNNVDSVVRKSDYLVEKLGYSYQHLSKTFSAYETVTLERYIILQKTYR